MNSDDKYAWLGLYLISGLGNSGFKRLLEVFGSPEAVFEAKCSELEGLGGVQREVARRIVGREFEADPEGELNRLEQCGARLLTFEDPEYPDVLKSISQPPMVLYARGANLPGGPAIAVVGSRHPSHYGLKAAEKIGMGLAGAGIGVVSGMARGLDSAAHRGCLRGDGYTIAVMGTGIDVVYPSENRVLYEQIIERGTILTEFPTGMHPEPRNFPIRNRIISGLARGVVVVEATRRSGSLITASFALDQGRELFAVPGSIDSFKSTGTHWLIKQGAKLVENVKDIVEELELGLGEDLGRNSEDEIQQAPPPMDEPERKIHEIVGDYPIHIDDVVRQAGMEAGEVLSILLRMELRGLIKQLPGKRFVR